MSSEEIRKETDKMRREVEQTDPVLAAALNVVYSRTVGHDMGKEGKLPC